MGPAVPGELYTDSQGMMNADTGLSMSTDYIPKYLFRCIVVDGTGAGQAGVTVKAQYANGAYKTWTFTVAANDSWEKTGAFSGIWKTGITATNIFPFF